MPDGIIGELNGQYIPFSPSTCTHNSRSYSFTKDVQKPLSYTQQPTR
jgi:hypothetical protein